MPIFTPEALRSEIEELLRLGSRGGTDHCGPHRPDASKEQWFDVLHGRRSHREYNDRSIPSGTLRRVVSAAMRSCGEDLERGTGLELYIAENEHDSHLTISEYRAGTVIGTKHDRVETVRILAREYAPAPVTLLIAEEPLSNTAKGYGNRLVRAGAFGYACWLSGRVAGLEGCVFGRTSPEFDGLLRDAGRGSRHIFTVTLGFVSEMKSGSR